MQLLPFEPMSVDKVLHIVPEAHLLGVSPAHKITIGNLVFSYKVIKGQSQEHKNKSPTVADRTFVFAICCSAIFLQTEAPGLFAVQASVFQSFLAKPSESSAGIQAALL